MAICPNCGLELTHRPVIGSDITTTRVGVEYPDLYDGILFWRCPQCAWAWPREFRHQRYLALASRQQADWHNAWNSAGKMRGTTVSARHEYAPAQSSPVEQVNTITCPQCGMTSYNPNDIAQGYCGNCHDWTGMAKEDYDVPGPASP